MSPSEIEQLLEMPLAFSGYHPPGGGQVADFYPTLTHWVESERFRGVHERVRNEVLSMPTPREVRKYARNVQARNILVKQRPDWQGVSKQVLAAGLLMAIDQNPEIADRFSPLAQMTSLELSAGLVENPIIHGQAYKALLGTFHAVAEMKFHTKNVLLVASVKKQTYAERKAQIEKHVSRMPISLVLCPVVKEMAPIGAEYAIANQLPLRYLTSDTGKLTTDLVDDLVQRASHLIVFERRGGKAFDELIDLAKKNNLNTKLFLV